MNEKNVLAEDFEANRAYFGSVAYRMLGSRSEAEDAVQEAWLRLNRADATSVENLRAWLTTVVARICLDMLRSRKSRREEPYDANIPEPVAAPDPAKEEALLADSVGLALLVVLDRLWRRPSAWLSCCTTCSIFSSRRSRVLSGARPWPPGSWRAARVAG